MKITFYFLIEIENEQNIRNSSGVNDAHERIVEGQIRTIRKSFYAVMNDYYESVTNHRETCSERIKHQDEQTANLTGFNNQELIDLDKHIEEMYGIYYTMANLIESQVKVL